MTTQVVVIGQGEKLEYVVNVNSIIRVNASTVVSAQSLADATIEFDRIIDQFFAFEVNVAELLGMRNLSSFVGELYASRVLKTVSPLFRKNPHQDGYPDLLLMDEAGARRWSLLKDRLREKAPFSPFPGDGIEVKATCGSVPTPAALARRNLLKPGIGDQRISLLTGYDWKAHHRSTNHLLGVFWDFIDNRPKIVAVFYSNELSEVDWGAIVQPTVGGGRTTSVSIMTRAGVKKMCQGWAIMLKDDKYRNFFSRYNGIPIVFP